MVMRYFSNEYLYFVFERAEPEDLLPVQAQLGLPQRLVPTLSSERLDHAEELARHFVHIAQNSFKAALTKDEEPVNYFEVLVKIAFALGLSDSRRIKAHYVDIGDATPPISKIAIFNAIEWTEDAIAEKFATALYGRLSPADREKFLQEISKQLTTDQLSALKRSLAAGGALLLGNLGGFGTYTTLSALIHTVSFGTLGFAAYTTASTAMSLVLGPPGWAAIAAYALFRLADPDMRRLAIFASTVGMIRTRRSLNYWWRE